METKNPAPKIGRPPKYKTVEQLTKAIQGYFESCWAFCPVVGQFGPVMVESADSPGEKVVLREWRQVRPYTVTGLAIACGMDRQMLLNYSVKGEFHDTIKRAKEMCQQYSEEMLFVSKNPGGAQFSLMNNWNWRAKSEQDMNIKGSVEIAERARRARERANAK